MTIPILERCQDEAFRRISYGVESSQFVEIRAPGRAERLPAVVALHGGFWKARYSLDYFGHVCRELTNLGFVSVNVEYRRVGEPGGGWPGTLTDIVSALNWVCQNAESFGIDRDRVFILGHSAGAQLAFWSAGASSADFGLEPGLRIAGVISLGGVLDLGDADERQLGSGAVAGFLGGSSLEVPGRYEQASPAALVPLGVPQLIIHGEQDDTVPVSNAEGYYDRAVEPGESVYMVIIPEAGHFELVDPESEVWPFVLETIVAFCNNDQ